MGTSVALGARVLMGPPWMWLQLRMTCYFRCHWHCHGLWAPCIQQLSGQLLGMRRTTCCHGCSAWLWTTMGARTRWSLHAPPLLLVPLRGLGQIHIRRLRQVQGTQVWVWTWIRPRLTRACTWTWIWAGGSIAHRHPGLQLYGSSLLHGSSLILLYGSSQLHKSSLVNLHGSSLLHDLCC